LAIPRPDPVCGDAFGVELLTHDWVLHEWLDNLATDVDEPTR
jgi:hypothetical protein